MAQVENILQYGIGKVVMNPWLKERINCRSMITERETTGEGPSVLLSVMSTGRGESTRVDLRFQPEEEFSVLQLFGHEPDRFQSPTQYILQWNAVIHCDYFHSAKVHPVGTLDLGSHSRGAAIFSPGEGSLPHHCPLRRSRP